MNLITNTIKHIFAFTVLLLLGCEVAGWIYGIGFGMYKAGILGVGMAWPALIGAALYTEYQLWKARSII